MKKKLLYPAYKVKRKPPKNLEEVRRKEDFFIQNYEFDSAYLCELENVYVSPYGIVFKNWKLIKESLSWMHVNNNFYKTFIKKRVLGRVRKVNGLSIVFTHSFYDNFYHFTAECLPRLYSVREYANTGQVLINERMPKFIKAYLEIFGFKNIVAVKDNELILAEKVLLPMQTAHGHSHNGELLSQMSAWIKGQLNITYDNSSEFKNVYLSRKKAAYRYILNEEELVALLKEYGFKTVYLEDYSVPEQIKLFSNVQNLVAVHGAGNTNIIYMPKGGRVIELIHDDHLQPCYYNLADALQLNYLIIQGPGANIDLRGPCYDSFTIDLQKLKYYLDKMWSKK